MKRIKLYLEDCKFFGANPLSYKSFKRFFKNKEDFEKTLYK